MPLLPFARRPRSDLPTQVRAPSCILIAPNHGCWNQELTPATEPKFYDASSFLEVECDSPSPEQAPPSPGGVQYGRRVARNATQRADLERAKYIAEMNAYFQSIDSFQLAEEAADAPEAPKPSTHPARSLTRRFSFQSRLAAPLEPLAETDLAAVPCSPSSDACSSIYQEAMSSPRAVDGVHADEDEGDCKQLSEANQSSEETEANESGTSISTGIAMHVVDGWCACLLHASHCCT